MNAEFDRKRLELECLALAKIGAQRAYRASCDINTSAMTTDELVAHTIAHQMVLQAAVKADAALADAVRTMGAV